MKPNNYPTEPAHLWQHFYDITQIPRPSKQEEKISQWVIGLAEEQGHSWKSDAAGNLVIYVPGTPGYQNHPTVIIQNHLDMVTVKTADKEHDFSQDPLALKIEDGWLLADRTTLGADNGVGAAAALAVMTDPSVKHPPLELLFTMDEETGLNGASALDASLLSGTRMLNLDTEEWHELYIGCAGGKGWSMTRSVEKEPVPGGWQGYQIHIKGLLGGHSGVQIHQQLGNAIKLIGQWLSEAAQFDVRLASFRGGVAHNVIAREASATFVCNPEHADQLDQLCSQLKTRWLSYLTKADHGLEVLLTPVDVTAMLEFDDAQHLVQLINSFPHGAQTYNAEQPADLVDLSINLAVLNVRDTELQLQTSLRYFNDQEAKGLETQVMALAQVFHLSTEVILDYPGWQPEFDNPMLKLTAAQYAEMHDGKQPAIKAIHAGLECGILKSKKPDVDIISFGPTIRGAHSPTERLQIDTVGPFWQLLTRLLASL